MQIRALCHEIDQALRDSAALRILFAHTTIVILLLWPASGFAESIAPKAAPASDLRIGAHRMVGADRLSDLPVFTDVAAAVGMKTRGYTFSNPIWGDFDGDGDLDLFADNHFNKAPYLYQNNGDGTFTDIFATSGVAGPGDKHGSAWADYDNDGDLDLSITLGAAHGRTLGEKKDELYEYVGGGQFVNRAEDAGVINTWGRGRGMAWADFDRDGYLDLLDANLRTDMVLYKNNGDGTFTDVTVQAGLGQLRYIECAFADYDNDGFPDIFCTEALSSNTSPDALYRNNGDGTFTDVTDQAGILHLFNGRAIAWGDYDNDGDLDLFISRGTDVGQKQTFYRNNGDGTFTDLSDESGLGVVNNNRAAVWGDFDNDGYLDLYVVNSGTDPVGKGPNFLYLNNHDGTFTDVAAETGVEDLVESRGRGAAWGDYDNDGFLDLFVTNGEDNTDFNRGPQFLYRNQGNGNHWLKIKLVGTVSNRQGLGAKVTLQAGGMTQFREMNGADGHFYGQGSTPLHFGLGAATAINRITVQWPSGSIQTLRRVSADQEITVTETP
jgi:hypothetical protein